MRAGILNRISKILIVGCLLHSFGALGAASLPSNPFIVEEYELGSTDELQIEDLEGLRVWQDTTLLSKRAKWRSEKPKVEQLLHHIVNQDICVIQLPTKTVTLEIMERERIGMEEELHLLVSEDDQPRCDIIARGSPVVGTIQTAYAWKDNYVIEFIDLIYVNCSNQNNELGHSAIFHYRILDDRVFYFYRDDDGKYWLSYDGQTNSNAYDDIIRYKCCGLTPLNIMNSELMVSFYGQRDGRWYYVEAGLFE
jgi:hypothetical protein